MFHHDERSEHFAATLPGLPDDRLSDSGRGTSAAQQLRGGYPPIGVRPQDRPAYITALQDALSGRDSAAFERRLYERLDATWGSPYAPCKRR
jgi:hypothetical protein